MPAKFYRGVFSLIFFVSLVYFGHLDCSTLFIGALLGVAIYDTWTGLRER